MPALSKTISNPQRQPPPALFLGPPSRDASHVSLPSVLLPGAHASSIGAPLVPPHRSATSRGQPGLGASGKGLEGRDAGTQSPRLRGVGHTGFLPQEGHRLEPPVEQSHADQAEALWAEMQSTLEDVELSATHDTHVFGPEHIKSLADLRNAQIALAEAWAKSEMHEAEKAADPGPVTERSSLAVRSDVTAANEIGPGVDGKNEAKAEEQAGDDISVAKKRREENDRFFERTHQGVKGVMAKLDDVANAMRAVERESRDIWSESSTSSSTSIS